MLAKKLAPYNSISGMKFKVISQVDIKLFDYLMSLSVIDILLTPKLLQTLNYALFNVCL